MKIHTSACQNLTIEHERVNGDITPRYFFIMVLHSFSDVVCHVDSGVPPRCVPCRGTKTFCIVVRRV